MRYFNVDDTRNSSNSFNTSCADEAAVESLQESCSDCHIREITEAQYLAAEQASNDTGLDPDDLFVWADGTFCARSEVAEFAHMSDDYQVLAYGTPAWDSFTHAAEEQ